ncbi:MAG: PEP-CTERM sorting domain-containing protein [Phycisphaerales bacterium]|nr:PEP-CTERM sorting domain-containing protein [Phycisphaerales bacterium]
MSKVIAVLTVAGLAAAASAEQVTIYDFDGNVVGGRNLSFTQYPLPGFFASAGDGFEVYQRGVSASIPYSLLDDTLTYPTDAIGIVQSTKLDAWFGMTDTVNDDLPDGIVYAEWEFDISLYEDLAINIDMGAMGDYEGPGSDPDYFDWTVSIDGGGFVPLFTSYIDQDGTHTYLMEDGTTRDVDDPLYMNGVLIDNIFSTQTAAVAGTGSVLTLRFDGRTNGGSEAYAFDNIEITGIPAPGTLALFGLGGMAVLRRRR